MTARHLAAILRLHAAGTGIAVVFLGEDSVRELVEAGLVIRLGEVAMLTPAGFKVAVRALQAVGGVSA